VPHEGDELWTSPPADASRRPQAGPSLDVGTDVRQALAAGHLEVPLPLIGQTGDRWNELRGWGRRDLAFAKLSEAHADAVAILAEAGRAPVPGALYAVWASRSRGSGLVADVSHAGGVEISGELRFASGAALVDRALVTAMSGTDVLLLDLDVRRARPTVRSGTWQALGMNRVDSPDITVHRTALAAADRVGEVGWYLSRRGFWAGSLGMVAIWLGALEGVVDTFVAQLSRYEAGPHELAHLGACVTQVQALRRTLDRTAEELDGAPEEDHRMSALVARSLADFTVTDVLRRTGRALGPVPLVRDRVHAQRVADLEVWVRQTHAERDLQSIGESFLDLCRDPADPSAAGPPADRARSGAAT